MACDLSTLTRVVGYDQIYSESEFKQHLKVDLTWKKCKGGWCFWRQESELAAAAVDESDEVTTFDSLISSIGLSGSEIKDRIKCLVDQIASNNTKEHKYLVQFWAPTVDEHLYLSTAHQPFAVGPLRKGFCWYRERCMRHRYRVDEGAGEEGLGVVGRVYRSKYPESTPDLRLYSTNEFPLRDDAARSGVRSLLVLPVFDLHKEKCYGVIEVSYPDFKDMVVRPLSDGLRAAKLRTTHCNLSTSDLETDVDKEIPKMLELAFMVMPQLQMAQAWIPCRECRKTSDNLSCMERATHITVGHKKVNLRSNDDDMQNYLKACSIHNLQVGHYSNMIAEVMSSNNKACICWNICNFSITENPLVHYAHKARLSFCFAICLESWYDSRDVYVVEFFLPINITEDAFTRYFLPRLFQTMWKELKRFDFEYEGQPVEGMVIVVCKGIKFSFNESSQPNALTHESIKYKHQHSEEISMQLVNKGFDGGYLLSDFTKYLQKAALDCLPPSEKSRRGWIFWSQPSAELSEDKDDSHSSLLPNRIQENIILLMIEITSNSGAHLVQFWAPKRDLGRCYLETSDQPFALDYLCEGLAYFRKQCMEHKYFVDEEATEGELGPPGRVFLNGHPEITPDLLLYSPTEFPLRNHVAHGYLKTYIALPLFYLNQHKCIGVLELVLYGTYALEAIGKALVAKNFSSTHMIFKPSLQGSHPAGNNDDSCRKLALAEMKEMRKAFEEIPHLHMVEVWVSYSKCPRKRNTLSCMERVWATRNIPGLVLPMCQIQHIEAGKGILGMALASENKACFCRNLGGFSIADRPLSHFSQQVRLDACFAICLQSQYTGDLVYALEFYLNQGPRYHESLMSFLCMLLPIMKQKLTSFKVASGQQLGAKLVVEVIEFSEINELASSEVDQRDEFPFTFKFVKYNSQHHPKDKQVLFDPEGSVESVVEAEHNRPSAANSKEKCTEKERNKENEAHFGQKRKDAEKSLDSAEITLKRICRKYGNENHKEKTGPSGCRNLLPSDMPHDQNVALTDPKCSEDVIAQPKADTTVIYAKYENKTIKFKLSHSAGMEKLVNEVGTRLKLDVGSFELEYLDEINEKILLTCDSDLELSLESMAAVGQSHIQVFVKSI